MLISKADAIGDRKLIPLKAIPVAASILLKLNIIIKIRFINVCVSKVIYIIF